jgi:hypothetical protein
VIAAVILQAHVLSGNFAMRRFQLLPIALTASLSACATIVTGTTQPIAIDTVPEGASCHILQGGVPVADVPRTPDYVRVAKTSAAIQVSCSKPGYRNAELTELSGVNGWLFGNLAIGGVVGIVVDFSSGAAYRYTPSMSLALEEQAGGPQTSYHPPYGDSGAPADITSVAQSEAERFRAATGRSLPAEHGLIVLPPAIPGGDPTYIWPSSHME